MRRVTLRPPAKPDRDAGEERDRPDQPPLCDDRVRLALVRVLDAEPAPARHGRVGVGRERRDSLLSAEPRVSVP